MLCWVVGMYGKQCVVHKVILMGAFLVVGGVETGVFQFCWTVDLGRVWDLKKGACGFKSERRTDTGGCDTFVFVTGTNMSGCWSNSYWISLKAPISCFSLSSALSSSSMFLVRASLIFTAVCISSTFLLFRCSFNSSICFSREVLLLLPTIPLFVFQFQMTLMVLDMMIWWHGNTITRWHVLLQEKNCNTGNIL